MGWNDESFNEEWVANNVPSIKAWLYRCMFYAGFEDGVVAARGSKRVFIPSIESSSGEMCLSWIMKSDNWAKIVVSRDDGEFSMSYHRDDDPFTKYIHLPVGDKKDAAIDIVESEVKSVLPYIKIRKCHMCDSRFDTSEASGGEWICDKCKKSLLKNLDGYVYLVGNEDSGYFKIGKSKDARNRLIQLKAVVPFDIHVIHTVPCDDMHTAEKALHSLYSSKRSKGEWFSLDADDIDSIKRIESFQNGSFVRP